MNHLAHALLAGHDDALRLGGLLGDFVTGRPENLAWPAEVVRGIRLHRAIDVFTDAHPDVVAARQLLPPPYRRYAGIVLDMWFDHCLARDFERWTGQPLAPYSRRMRQFLHGNEADLPAALLRFLAYMDAHDLPAAYAEPQMMGRALAGVGQRLRHDNPLDRVLPVLQAQDARLQRYFEGFFPDVQRFAAHWRSENPGTARD